jgi:hypothetical protein
MAHDALYLCGNLRIQLQLEITETDLALPADRSAFAHGSRLLRHEVLKAIFTARRTSQIRF